VLPSKSNKLNILTENRRRISPENDCKEWSNYI